MNFGKCKDSFGQLSWSKIDFNYLDVKHKLLKRDDNRDVRLVQILTTGQADINQFMRLKNQLAIAAENFAGEENSSPVFIPTMSKDIDEQLKLAHKVIDVMDRANRKICVTLLWYPVEKPESSYAHVRLIAKKKEDEKFQQIVLVNYENENFIYLLDVLKY